MADDLKPLIDEIKRGNALTTDLLKEKRADDTSKQILADAIPEVFAEYDSARMVNANIDEEAIKFEGFSSDAQRKSDNIIRQEFDFLTDIQMKMFRIHTRYYSEMMNIAAQLLGPRGIMGLLREGEKRGENTLENVAAGFVDGSAKYTAILEGKLEDIEDQRQEFDEKLKEESDGASASAEEEKKKDEATTRKNMFQMLGEKFTSGFKGLQEGISGLTDSLIGKVGFATVLIAFGSFLISKFPKLAEVVGKVIMAIINLFKDTGKLFSGEMGIGEYLKENILTILGLGIVLFRKLIFKFFMNTLLPFLTAKLVAFLPILGKALLGMLGKVLLVISNPYVLLGALIVGIGVLIYKYWDEITAFFTSVGEYISATISEIGKEISAFFTSVGESISAKISEIGKEISTFTSNLFTEVSGLYEEYIANPIRDIFQYLKDLFTIDFDSMGDSILSFFSGDAEAKYMGGAVAAGSPYIVGEKGPELFVPGASGSIVPNGGMGGGAPIIVTNNNISAPTNNSSHQHSNISITDNQQEIVGL